MTATANILGVKVHAITIEQAAATMDGWIERREQNYVACAPVYCLMDCQRDETLRGIYNHAGLVVPDGVPVVWVLRLMGFREVERVYGPDLMLAMCQRGVRKGYRHYLYGGTASVIQKLTARLRERFPGIQIVGMHAPPFPYTAEDDEAVVTKINSTKPDIVWCGLGTSEEKYWNSGHLCRLEAPVLMGVGAAFDFLSGTKRQAPRWMMRMGLEWFFRLLCEPLRLGPRYLVNNPLFVWRIAMQALGRKPAAI